MPERAIHRVAAELAALRLAQAADKLMPTADSSVFDAEPDVWVGAIRSSLPRELNTVICHSKVLGVACARDGTYFAAYAMNRSACVGSNCAYGDDLVFSRGKPKLWQMLVDGSWEPFYEWRSADWDPRDRPWMKSTGWVRYADPVTKDNIESFVAPFCHGVVIAGSFVIEGGESTWTTLTDPKMVSRVLYSNPVCVMTVRIDGKRNSMTLSWLTPVSNDACFVISVSRTRYTANAIGESTGEFGLSVMVAGQESLVLAIGGCSGAQVDKEADIPDLDYDGDIEDGAFFVRGAVARLSARVLRILHVHLEHYIVLAKIERAQILSSYWSDGKIFSPVSPLFPPPLSFLGSKQFAHARRPCS